MNVQQLRYDLEALRKERDELQADCSKLGRAVVGYEKRIEELEEEIRRLRKDAYNDLVDYLSNLKQQWSRRRGSDEHTTTSL